MPKIAYTDRQFELARSAVTEARALAFANWKKAADSDEKAFYSLIVDEYDTLIALYDKIDQADTSQEPDEEDGD